MTLNFLIVGWVQGCVYFIVGLGFAMIYGPTRVFHFAHGAVCLSAAYAFYDLYRVLSWPLPVAALCSVVVAALLGAIIEKAIHQPLMKSAASSLVHLLSSIGLSITLINLLVVLHGNGTKLPAQGLRATISIGSGSMTVPQVAIGTSAIAVLLILLFVIRKARVGRLIRGLQDDPELLSTLGFNADRLRLALFSVGSALAAIGAVLSSLDVGFDPSTGVSLMLNGVVAVIVGGVSRLEGVALGALLLGVVQSLAVMKLASGWQDAVTFVVLIVFLLIKPEGLLGRVRRMEESR
jgi:branched-chain amino acid transport system permease protein